MSAVALGAGLAGWAIGFLQAGQAWFSVAAGLTAVAVVAIIAVCAVYVAALFSAAKASQRLDRGIEASLRGTQASLGRASRLARAEEIFASDPDGRTIDPQREPELFRLYLFHTGRIDASGLASHSDREAALERLADDADRIRELFAQQDVLSTADADAATQQQRIEEISRSLAGVTHQRGQPG
ncbi:hypothetical protein [Marinimicrococcus flavescens]|uniref:Uncharacterized protein n=1 Tax=Marinimicrococcus flavescens TaxID=3031815 RepID=A0AAP3XT17_9PROT|nr:hypothetical protein [Marinimicrococcus flavescens]